MRVVPYGRRVGWEEELLVKLKLVNYQLEVLVKQKLGAKWIKEEDVNTKYFHRTIKWRRLKNNIRGLKT